MKYLLTLDVGTTAVKAALFDGSLKQKALVIREYALQTPRQDWVELEPRLYWDNGVKCIRQAVEEAAVQPRDIASITCTTQGETLIPVAKDGSVLSNAIVWLDARARQEAETLRQRYGKEEFYRKTGVPEATAYTPLSKLMWLKNNLPEVYENTYKFLLVEDYFIYRLCGAMVTNPAVLCSTAYYGIGENKLWTEALSENGLDFRKIPEILPCASVVAPLCEAAANELGLCESTLVTTGAMDQVASAVGAGNTKPGIVSESTGTCLCLAATVQNPHLERWQNTEVYCHAVPGLFLPVAVAQTAGMILRWFRDEFCIDLLGKGDFDRMSALAGAEPAGSRGLLLFPHLTGMENDPSARGVFFGFGLDTTRGCFIRAVMEGVGYTLKDGLGQMELEPQRLLSLGGGAKSAVWNQIKANICNTVICTAESGETASVGAAMLGGVACGVFKSLDEAATKLRAGDIFYPEPDEVKLYANEYKRFSAMYEHFKPLFVEE